MSKNFPWGVLQIARTTDRKAIRTAYAAVLKTLDVDKQMEAYAELRDARDEALAQAREAEQSVGLGPVLADDVADLGDGGDLGELGEIEPLSPEELGPDIPPAQEQPQAGRSTISEDIPNRLAAILVPNGERIEDPLTFEENEECEGLIAQILADAQGTSIDVQHNIESWLAHILATAWPRSGPLVSEVRDHFGWARSAGLLDEDPAVAFLNDQLATLDFVAELEDPAQYYHTEWVELKQPGKRGFNPFRKARVDKINALLASIRQNHPQAEEYLSPERVASWTEPDSVGSPWGGVLKWGGGLYLLAVVIGAVFGDEPNTDDPPTALFDTGQPWTAEEKQALLDRLFGAGIDEASLQQNAPIIAEAFERQTASRIDTDAADERTYEELARVLRYQSRRAAAHAPFAELVAIQQARLDMLRLVRDSGNAQDCVTASLTGSLPASVVPSAEFEQQEAAVFGRLLQAEIFQFNDAQLPTTAQIPGWVVDGVMANAGMSVEKFTELAQGNGSPAEQCDYTIAMLETMLRRPGDVSAELLRMI